jgi:hypothetical protein
MAEFWNLTTAFAYDYFSSRKQTHTLNKLFRETGA